MDFQPLRIKQIRLFNTRCFLLLMYAWKLTTAAGNDSGIKTSIACYGSDVCSTFSMSCHGAQRIEVVSLEYGTKTGTGTYCLSGISDCNDGDQKEKCCSYNSTDLFTEFSISNKTTVLQLCQGKSECHGRAPRLITSPYSSYVRMQYACVEDTNLVHMCQSSNATGSDLFMTFNLTKDYILPTINGTRDCSCLLRTEQCNTRLKTTFANLQFMRPSDTEQSVCSSASLVDSSLNISFSCPNVLQQTVPEILQGTKVISLKHLYQNGSYDRPKLLLMHYSAAADANIYLECFPPGVDVKPSSSCSSTTYHPSSTKLSSSPATSPITTANLLSSVSKPTVTKSDISSTSSTLKPISLSNPVQSSSPTTLMSDKPSMAASISASTVQTSFNSPSKPSTTTSVTTTQRNYSSGYTETSSPISRATTDHPTEFSVSTSTTAPLHSINETVITSTPRARTSSERVNSKNTQSNLHPTETTSLNVNISLPTSSKSFSVTTSLISTKISRNISITANTASGPTGTVIPTTPDIPDRTDDDNGMDRRGLVIGITVGAVLAVILLVAIIMMCLCIRIKRKENVRKNYIRNTNIFYSFAEDSDTGSMRSGAVEGQHRDWYSSPLTNREDLLESSGNPSDTALVCNNNNFVYPESNKTMVTATVTTGEPHLLLASRLSDDTYSSETSNDTIEFYNATEPCPDSMQDGGSSQNGRVVTFDPLSMYSSVVKDARTQF